MATESTRAVPVQDTTATGDLTERRLAAIAEASDEVRGRAAIAGPDAGSSAVALRSFGRGCLVVALAGTFDRAGVEEVRRLRGDLTRLAHTELVLELVAVADGQPALARAVAGLRIARLSAGARVELHHPSAELRAEVGAWPVEAYTVHDEDPPQDPSHDRGERR